MMDTGHRLQGEPDGCFTCDTLTLIYSICWCSAEVVHSVYTNISSMFVIAHWGDMLIQAISLLTLTISYKFYRPLPRSPIFCLWLGYMASTFCNEVHIPLHHTCLILLKDLRRWQPSRCLKQDWFAVPHMCTVVKKNKFEHSVFFRGYHHLGFALQHVDSRSMTHNHWYRSRSAFIGSYFILFYT